MKNGKVNKQTGTTKPKRGQTKSMMKASVPFKGMAKPKTTFSKKMSK